MPIKIKIDPDASTEEAIAETQPQPDAVISLEVRKTLDGKIMILDHMHLDMVDEDNLIDEAEDTQTILSKYVNNMKLNSNQIDRVQSTVLNLYQEAIDIA